MFDVFLYAAFAVACLRALTAPTIGFNESWPIVAFLSVLGLLDVTIWLAARSEVYLYMLVCFMFAESAPAAVWSGVKCVQLGIWLWASVSKWGEWFPFVVQTMVCNSFTWPLTTKAVHRAMFRSHPSDLRASTVCWLVA